MYDIVKNVIESSRYELSDILRKIDTIWLQGNLTEEEHTELATLARERADPTQSYAPLQKQIDNLYLNLGEIAESIKTLENRIVALEGGTVEPPETEEYPQYIQPMGTHDAYKMGDKVTYNNKKYICWMDGCVWSPADYPQGWKEVEGAEGLLF